MQASKIVRWQNLTITLMLTGICLIAGSYSQKYYKQWDVTAQDRHTLSDTSKAVINLLEHPLKVLAILGPSEKPRSAVKDLIARYQAHKPDIELDFLNPETNPSRVQTLGANPEGEIIFYYNNENEQRINQLSERVISNALLRLARPDNRRVLFVTGHQERQATGKRNKDYNELFSRLSEIGFIVGKISLVTQPVIPDDTDLLVIAAPIDNYFPGEVASILSYLGTGGNLLWLREPDLHNNGLNALELELGVSFLAGKIVEANSRLFNVDSPTFVIVNQYPANPVTVDFDSITLFPEAAGLRVLAIQEQTIRPLVTSSENSWTETGEIEGQVKFDENSEETRGPIVLGVTMERNRLSRNQRIAVIGDADFMANTWLGNGGNRAFSERLLGWLTAGDRTLNITSFSAPDLQIIISNSSVLTMAISYLVVFPLILFIVAFLVWHTRRRG